MNNSNQYDELLIKYLADELNAEEKNFVENWIYASEENRRYFEELKHVWNLAIVKQTLEKVNLDEEWNQFQENIAASEAKIISLNQQEESGIEYVEEESPGRKSVVYRLLVAAAIAASVLLVAGLGWKLFFQGKQETQVAINPKEAVDSVLTFVHHEVNRTGKEKRIQLPDGSLIVLAHNSEITYQVPFTDKRDITLKGKANFKVAKDKTRPFTVISGTIATTALGTEFTVTAFENTSQIIVRLYEGKVVVKAVDKENWRMKNDVYLLPGQELVYSDDEIVRVRAFNKSNAASEKIKSKELSLDNPSIPTDTEGSWFMFNNQSLEQVLDQLAGLYNAKIVYDKKDVQNIYFTGKYNKSHSLETILKRIGSLNNLTITKKDTAFIISK